MEGGEIQGKKFIQMLARYAKTLNNFTNSLNDGMQQDCRSFDNIQTRQLPVMSLHKKKAPKPHELAPNQNNPSPHFCCNNSRVVPV